MERTSRNGLLNVGTILAAVLVGTGNSTEKGGQVTREFTITGMTCGGCAAGVKMTLKRLDGVLTLIEQ